MREDFIVFLGAYEILHELIGNSAEPGMTGDMLGKIVLIKGQSCHRNKRCCFSDSDGGCPCCWVSLFKVWIKQLNIRIQQCTYTAG